MEKRHSLPHCTSTLPDGGLSRSVRYHWLKVTYVTGCAKGFGQAVETRDQGRTFGHSRLPNPLSFLSSSAFGGQFQFLVSPFQFPSFVSHSIARSLNHSMASRAAHGVFSPPPPAVGVERTDQVGPRPPLTLPSACRHPPCAPATSLSHFGLRFCTFPLLPLVLPILVSDFYFLISAFIILPTAFCSREPVGDPLPQSRSAHPIQAPAQPGLKLPAERRLERHRLGDEGGSHHSIPIPVALPLHPVAKPNPSGRVGDTNPE